MGERPRASEGRRDAQADAVPSDAKADVPADAGAADSGQPPAACVVDPAGRTAPFPTQFRFRNDTDAPVFINKGSQCGGVDFSVSSCASGFRDRLGPVFTCACACDSTVCTGSLACGPCPPSEALAIAAGTTTAVDWSAVVTTVEQKSGVQGVPFMCLRHTALPAGRYRVAIRVFDDAASAAKNTGGRTVTRDFSLPADTTAVDVPLSANPLDTCDATPAAAAPTCTGGEARDVPCSLPEPLDFALEGGNGPTSESSRLEAPAAYTHQRVARSAPTQPVLTCAGAIPRCARDSRVVTTADVTRVLGGAGVRAAFAANTPVYGYDQRANDGGVWVLRRSDGTSLAIGTACDGCATGAVTRPLTPALAAIPPVLSLLDQQMFATAACAAFGPPYRY